MADPKVGAVGAPTQCLEQLEPGASGACLELESVRVDLEARSGACSCRPRGLAQHWFSLGQSGIGV